MVAHTTSGLYAQFLANNLSSSSIICNYYVFCHFANTIYLSSRPVCSERLCTQWATTPSILARQWGELTEQLAPRILHLAIAVIEACQSLGTCLMPYAALVACCKLPASPPSCMVNRMCYICDMSAGAPPVASSESPQLRVFLLGLHRYAAWKLSWRQIPQPCSTNRPVQWIKLTPCNPV